MRVLTVSCGWGLALTRAGFSAENGVTTKGRSLNLPFHCASRPCIVKLTVTGHFKAACSRFHRPPWPYRARAPSGAFGDEVSIKRNLRTRSRNDSTSRRCQSPYASRTLPPSQSASNDWSVEHPGRPCHRRYHHPCGLSTHGGQLQPGPEHAGPGALQFHAHEKHLLAIEITISTSPRCGRDRQDGLCPRGRITRVADAICERFHGETSTALRDSFVTRIM